MLCDYLHLLERWEKEYAPHTPEEAWNPLFVEALQKNAVSIVLLHNHPSGDPTPSKEDLLTTRRIREAGALIGIELLDHIIIGDNCYFSLREKGFFSQESANR